MRLFGIPIKFELSFFVIALFLGFSRSSTPVFMIEWVLVVFFSVLIHEFGHALTIKAFGMAPSIKLHGMGGLTSWTDAGRLSPIRRIAISLAGPFAGFLFGGLCFLCKPWLYNPRESLLLAVTYQDLLWVNLGWGVLNLLPILPMDGGNVVRSIEQAVFKKTNGMVAYGFSLVFAAAAGIWALTAGQTWILFLCGWFAFSNGAALSQLWRARSDDSLRDLLQQANEATIKNDGATAARLGEQIFQSARSVGMKRQGLWVLIYGLIREHQFERAGLELRRLGAVYGRDIYLEGLLLIEMGATEQGIAVLEPELAANPSQRVGLALADALVKAGRFDRAMDLCKNPRLAPFTESLYLQIQVSMIQSGELERAVEISGPIFETTRQPLIAYNAACALALTGRPEEAMAWMIRARAAGFDDVQMLRTDPDLEGLRGRPDFDLLVHEMALAKQTARSAG